MVSDATTFFLSFAAVFGALGYYLLRLERKVADLERRLRRSQDASTTVKDPEPDAGDGA